MARRLPIRVRKRPIIVVARAGLREKRLVYVACASRPQRYPLGRSPVVYIGTTQNGVSRIAASAARTARKALALHGVRELALYVVTCPSRSGTRSWRKLERALILAFKDVYGRVPVANVQGKGSTWKDEAQYFRLSRLRAVVRAFGARRGKLPPRSVRRT